LEGKRHRHCPENFLISLK
jgi:hypothetical protein